MRTATAQAAGATTELLQFFSEKWLPLSQKKTFFLASSDEAATKLVEGSPLVMEQRRRQGKMLGVDASDVSKRATATAAARQGKAVIRAKSFHLLLRRGAEIEAIHRAASTVSALWGCEVAGLTPSQLHGTRVAALLRARGQRCDSRPAPLVRQASVGCLA